MPAGGRLAGTMPTIVRDSPLLRLTALAVLCVLSSAHAETGIPNSTDRSASSNAQDTQTVLIEGDRLGGFVLPIEPITSELVLSCNNANRWKVDDTQRLLLRGDVNIDMGSYAFAADTAVIWINRLPSEKGLVNQVAIWFPSVSEPTRRAGLGASGRDVLVTASTLGAIRLRPVILTNSAPSSLGVVRDGEARLARYLKTIVAVPLPKLGARPDVEVPPRPVEPTLEPGGTLDQAPAPEVKPDPATIELPSTSNLSLPIFLPQGLVSFSANEIIIDEEEDAVTVLGSVLINYDSSGARDQFQQLSLSAKRGVVFLKEGTVSAMREGSGQVEAEAIKGIYLEGGVRVTDGEYTLRSSSIYYDLAKNKALALEAILRTYNRQRGNTPIYARATEMRQVSADQWTANKATLSTSAFFEPHISVGLDNVTITERPAQDGEEGTTTWVNGRNLTIEALGVPFFFWPGFNGEAETSPLKSIRAGWQRFKGVNIGTRWDFFALIGVEKPSWVAADLVIDGYVERGPGFGLDLNLSGLGGVSGNGKIDAYGLYDFGGTDRTAAGGTVEVGSEMRGQVVGEYRTQLSVDLMLETQISYLSDETWVSAWREGEFRKRREYETSAYLDWSPENSSLSLLVKGELNGFLANSWKLASRPYYVDKIPEVQYSRIGDDLWQTATWSSNYSFSRMSMNVTSGSPSTLGINRRAFASSSNTTDITDLYAGYGYNSDDVMRFHTRQEMSLPFSGEGWNIAPFVFGRFTGYIDGDFDSYRQAQGLDPDLSDYRFMAGGGVRADMEFMRVHDGARSDLFDINRVRHLMIPNMTLWYGWDSHPNGAFPIYDQQVEGATGGTAAQVGLRQVLQTQRGGPGNWTSVDFIELDIGAVFNDATDDFQRTDVIDPNAAAGSDPYNPYAWVQSPYPQFYRYEPELSQWGTHGYLSASWELSSTLTFATSGIFGFNPREIVDLTSGQPEIKTISGLFRGSIGMEMTHTPDTSTFLEYRYLGASDDELLQAGVLYRVGRKYMLTISPQYDLRRDEFRAFGTSLTRTFPDFDLNFNLTYNLIQDETTVGLRLRIPRNGGGQGFKTY